jgi:hypothetical protein
MINCHDAPLAAHFGIEKTYLKVACRYWWPKLQASIKDYCNTCEPCQKRKRKYGVKKAPLVVIPIGAAFERVAVDCLGPLPLTKSGNRHIVLFSCYFSKWPEAAALPSIEAPRIARAFYDLIITRHGAPRQLLSDHGSNFMGKLMKELLKILNIEKLSTTSYHPQTDGLVERMNGTLTQSLTMYANSNQDNWDNFLQSILFAYRTSVSAATGETPFMLIHGREARLPLDVALLPPT